MLNNLKLNPFYAEEAGSEEGAKANSDVVDEKYKDLSREDLVKKIEEELKRFIKS